MSEAVSAPGRLVAWDGPSRPAHPLTPRAWAVLGSDLGANLRPGSTPAIAAVEVAPGRLPEPALAALRASCGLAHVSLDGRARLAASAGRSYADLVRLRGGSPGPLPDAVVRPAAEDQVRAVLEVCARFDLAVVPRGGGTSVVGGLDADPGRCCAVIALDLTRLDALVSVCAEDLTVTAQAGIRGPALEAALAGHGLTLGHLPQSYEQATLGGYVAARSSGQASTGYGRLDANVLAVRAVTPAGVWAVGRGPATAAGPDLLGLLIGSEGAFGVLTEATLRVHRRPEATRYAGWFVPGGDAGFAAGLAALRELEQAEVPLCVARLSDADETRVSLALGGAGRATRGYLAARGRSDGCLVVIGAEGPPRRVSRAMREAARALRAAGGIAGGQRAGNSWRSGRFTGPFRRDELLDGGVLVETLETAAPWSQVASLRRAVRSALQDSLRSAGTPPLVGTHVSHLYPTHASLYVTVLARALGGPGPEGVPERLRQWEAAKTAATDALLAAGGTLTHHHGVGSVHAPWLGAEVGEVGLAVLGAVKAALDPQGQCNPATLLTRG